MSLNNVNNDECSGQTNISSAVLLPNKLQQELPLPNSQELNLHVDDNVEFILQPSNPGNSQSLQNFDNEVGLLNELITEGEEEFMEASQDHLSNSRGNFQPNFETNLQTMLSSARLTHQPKLKDEGLRHIYINNAEVNPSKYIGNTNPVTRSAELKSLIGDYIACKQLRSGSLLLEVKTFQQVQKVLGLTSLMGISIKPIIAICIGTIKGYAHEPRLMDMSTDILKEIWKDKGVLKVDRKITIENNRSVYNASLIITFKGDKLPFKLPIGDEWITIKKMKKKLLQCGKCNKLYHLTSKCRGEEICSKCGGKHTGDCQPDSTPACSNCKISGHGANDPECPYLIKEKEIANIRTQKKVGYNHANGIYIKQNKNKSQQNATRSLPQTKRRLSNLEMSNIINNQYTMPTTQVGRSWQTNTNSKNINHKQLT